MTGETEGKKSLKRYFPYKEYTIKAEFGFSLLDKGVYVIFFLVFVLQQNRKNFCFPRRTHEANFVSVTFQICTP